MYVCMYHACMYVYIKYMALNIHIYIVIFFSLKFTRYVYDISYIYCFKVIIPHVYICDTNSLNLAVFFFQIQTRLSKKGNAWI